MRAESRDTEQCETKSSVKQGVSVSREQGAESREQRAESREQRAESRESLFWRDREPMRQTQRAFMWD